MSASVSSSSSSSSSAYSFSSSSSAAAAIAVASSSSAAAVAVAVLSSSSSSPSSSLSPSAAAVAVAPSSSSSSAAAGAGAGGGAGCLIGDFPRSFTHYDARIVFKSPDERSQIIEFLAERVSTIYSAFLTADWHAKRSENLRFIGFPTKFPSTEIVEKFKIGLKNAIVTALSQKEDTYDSIHLSTDNGPETELSDVLKKNGVSLGYVTQFPFPSSTSTRIVAWNTRQIIDIDMSYSSNNIP